MTDHVANGNDRRGAGLALKAGKKAEAAEFFLKGREYETAALSIDEIGQHARTAVAYTKAERPLEAANAWEILLRVLAFQYDYRETAPWLERLRAEIAARKQNEASFEGERYTLGEILGRGGMGAVRPTRAQTRLAVPPILYTQ